MSGQEQEQLDKVNKAESGQSARDRYGFQKPTEQQKKYMYLIYIAYAIGVVFGFNAQGSYLSLSVGSVEFNTGSLGFFIGVIGVIIAYVKRDDMQGTVYASHIEFLISTFWTAFMLYIIGFILVLLIVGAFILLLVWLWCVIRVVSGLIKLIEDKPVSNGWILG